MSTIVTRAGKGSPLTWNEVDNNFTNLNTDKLEAATTSTLTNKTINLTSNTLTGTTAQFNTALSDGDFATLAGTETLTNKTITSPTITGGALNGTLGATTPSTVAATTISASGLITANGGVSGALNGTLGATTPSTVAATTISASGLITANGGVSGALNGTLGATTPSTVVATTVKIGTTATSTGGAGIIINSTTNSGSLQLGNNSGTGSNGGALLYGSSGNEYSIYTYTGAVGSETYVRKFHISASLTTSDQPLTVVNTIGVGNATPSTSGAGITFPATQSASTNANTLDDYEEGTWTPNQGAGLTVVGAFSSTGTYTKIGRQVTIQVVLSGATSIACAGASGAMCSNLPFAVSGQAIGGLTSGNNVATNTTYLLASTMYCNGGNVLATGSIIITATYFTS